MASIPELQQINPYLAEVEGFRTMARLHGVPTGTPECVVALPLRIAQDWRLRGNFVELLRELQRKDPEFSLPDALDVLLRAVGGATASPNRRRTLDESVDLTAAFLASLGGWPGPAEEPITDLENPPDHDPRLDHAFVADADTSEPSMDAPEQDAALEADVDPEPDADASQDAEPSTPKTAAGISLAEITQALARLERGSVDLRLHLDSIDQRLSRMEPLLESPATTATNPSPPVTPSLTREPEPVKPLQEPARTQPQPHVQSPAGISPERELVHRSDPAPQVSPTPAPGPADAFNTAITLPTEARSRPLTPRRDRFAAAMELPGTHSALHFPAQDEALHFSSPDAPAPSAGAFAEPQEASAPAPTPAVPHQPQPSAPVVAAPPPLAELPPIAPATHNVAPAANDDAPATGPAEPRPAAQARTTSFAAAAALTAERQVLSQQAHASEMATPVAAVEPVPVPTAADVSPKIEATPDAVTAPRVPAPASAVAPQEAVAEKAAASALRATSSAKPIPEKTPASLGHTTAVAEPAAPALSPLGNSAETTRGVPAFSFGGMAVAEKPTSSADGAPAPTKDEVDADSDETARRSRGPLVVGIIAALLIALAAFLLLRGKPLSFLLDKPASTSTTGNAATQSAQQPAVNLPPASPGTGVPPAAPASPVAQRAPNARAARLSAPATSAPSQDRVLGARQSMAPVEREQILATPTFVPEAVMKARLLSAPPPLYPTLANAVGLEGGVILEVIIARDGTVDGLTVLGGQHLLRDAATNAVRQWRYQPFLLRGEPVEVRSIIHVNVVPPAARAGTDTQ